MKYDMVRPCASCPFRADIRPYLRRSRVKQILRDITQNQMTFACHKTLAPGDDELAEMDVTDDSQHCAGAMILLEKMEKPNQMMRIAERLGMYDVRRLDMDALVYETDKEMINAHAD